MCTCPPVWPDLSSSQFLQWCSMQGQGASRAGTVHWPACCLTGVLHGVFRAIRAIPSTQPVGVMLQACQPPMEIVAEPVQRNGVARHDWSMDNAWTMHSRASEGAGACTRRVQKKVPAKTPTTMQLLAYSWRCLLAVLHGFIASLALQPLIR